MNSETPLWLFLLLVAVMIGWTVYVEGKLSRLEEKLRDVEYAFWRLRR